MAVWCSYHAMMWRGADFGPSLPTFHWVLFELVVCILMEEIGFYYTHRYDSNYATTLDEKIHDHYYYSLILILL